MVRLAFGRTLESLGTQTPDPDQLGRAVDQALETEIGARTKDVVLLLGCWLFEDDDDAYPVNVGPVTFHTRIGWLDEQATAGELSSITARRLRRQWSGEKVARRKRGFDQDKESGIADAVDRCPVVCAVRTHGLSIDLTEQKGLLAARLAMTALALPWADPQVALEHMNLIYDGGPRNRHYAIAYEGGFGSGSSWVNLPRGQSSIQSLAEVLTVYRPTFEVVGEALEAYVNPHAPVRRPKVSNALFLSLWWFHQGCREASDQMAVTAFAASLDALAAGGHAGGIKRLIKARLGLEGSDALMTDGRTTSAVINGVYDSGRSRFIHGSSNDYAEDWGGRRGTARAVARLLLLQVTHWLQTHPEVVDMKELQVA